jgi:RNA polymerase-binding transcription factor DksA
MIDTNVYKVLLETERDEILGDLKGMAVKDPLSGEFSTVSDTSLTEADDSDLGDRNEGFEEASALTDTLAAHLKEIESALGKIESGSFGTCITCGNEIQEDRLAINPSAPTCVEHMNS